MLPCHGNLEAFAAYNLKKFLTTMNIRTLFAVTLYAALPLLATAQTIGLTLEQVTGGAYYPQYVYGASPAADGKSYTQLSDDGRQILRRSFKTGETEEVLFDCAEAIGSPRIDRLDGYTLSPDGRRILLQTQRKAIYRHSYTAVHYVYDIAAKRYEPLSDGGPQQVPLFSPDGTMIAFVRNNDLYLVKLLFNRAESRVTEDGKFNAVLNGIPDWVNEEEFSTNRSFDFSSDSRLLAWVRYDESKVPVYSMTMYKGLRPELKQNDEYPGSYDYKYPVAGAKNSEVSVWSYDIQSHVTRQLEVPVDSDGYVPRIQFTSDPDRLCVVTLNRLQNDMRLYMVNARSTVAQMVLMETDDRYIKETAYGNLRFYPGQFVLMSGRTGYDHLYLYDLQGNLIRPLTKGAYDVTAFYGYDPKTGSTYYQSCAESPLRRAVYTTDKSGRERKLSTDVGTNSATFSADFKYFLNVFSSTAQPPVTTLRDADGKLLHTMVDNAQLKQRVDALGAQKEFFSFTTADGVQLNGWMLKPKDFDASKKYPLIMYQYSGPGSQEVKDAWNIGFMPGGLLETYMAERGYLFAIVDGRGTGARGADFEKCTYLHLGQLESHDQAEAAAYLGGLPYVDASRIGIWGWSFGGFNTLMSMSEGRGLFKAGVAVAAPSNWKYYDTVYTERFMRTPQQNAGYDDCPITRAPQLQGKLLLVHGTADDNVHFRNCTEMSEALVQAGKQFEMQIYTNRNHFINGGQTRLHLFRRIAEFFEKNL